MGSADRALWRLAGRLPHRVRHYNERRTHSALDNRPPIQRVRNVTGFDS